MDVLMAAVPSAVSALAVVVIWKISTIFSLRKDVTAIFLFPVVLFVTGFSMRLSGIQYIVDVGFFFTEFSFLLVYILFAMSFFLGQLKYWKKN